ncbi:MAG: copper resistance protein B [Erythrobacter sp.]|nr:MAG: copper resistance protein B [Erythrobacter sp.]
MMRSVLMAGAALLFAIPAAAQDHSGHAGHTTPAPTPMPQPAPEDHSAHQGMDHSHQGQPATPPVDHSQMDHGAMDHSQMDHGAAIPSGPPPARAFEGPAHAAAAIWGDAAMARARAANHEMHGQMRFATLMAERLEARVASGEDVYLWDVQGWYGTTTDRIVFKTEGEGEFSGAVDGAELQLLWGHAIGPWFDLQTGVRLDVEPETTAHLALGVQGLAPYMIHVDAAAFLSDEGDLTARIEAEHDMRLTQKLILQPRIEFELSAQDIPQRGIGAGPVKIETGLRLRYEIAPEFAPYVGVEYEAALGQTADIIRAEGDDPDGLVFLIGLRTWF